MAEKIVASPGFSGIRFVGPSGWYVVHSGHIGFHSYLLFGDSSCIPQHHVFGSPRETQRPQSPWKYDYRGCSARPRDHRNQRNRNLEHHVVLTRVFPPIRFFARQMDLLQVRSQHDRPDRNLTVLYRHVRQKRSRIFVRRSPRRPSHAYLPHLQAVTAFDGTADTGEHAEGQYERTGNDVVFSVFQCDNFQ